MFLIFFVRVVLRIYKGLETCIYRLIEDLSYPVVPVLESEVFMAPIELSLDQVVAQARLKRGTHPATTAGNERIRLNLRRSRAKRGRKETAITPPTESKLEWARGEVDLTYVQEIDPDPGDAVPAAREAEAKRVARAKVAAIAL